MQPGNEPTARGSKFSFTALGLTSAVVYVYVALGLSSSGSHRDVLLFLALFGGLFAIYFAAIYLVRRHREPASRSRATGRATRHILLWAVLFRVALLPAGLPQDTWRDDLKRDLGSQEIGYQSFLLYDNDVWRYLWDGHVVAAGLDPYRRSPADYGALYDEDDPVAVALLAEEVWEDVFDRISYEGYHTVYPPLAQALFALSHQIAPASVFVWKMLLVAFDIATCWLLVLLLRRWHGRTSDVVIYAWNPLVVKEIAGSGHVDAAMVFFLVLATYLLWQGRDSRRAAWGLVAFGLAILTKLTPLLLAPIVLRRVAARWWWLLPATLALGYLPFLSSLPTMLEATAVFAREWVFNPGPWLLVKWLAGGLPGVDGQAVARALALAGTLALVAWAVWRDDGSPPRLVASSFWVLGGYLLMSAAVMPWYLIWLLPFATLGWRSSLQPAIAGWLALTGLSLLSYLIYSYQVEHRWWLWIEYVGALAVWVVMYRAQRSA